MSYPTKTKSYPTYRSQSFAGKVVWDNGRKRIQLLSPAYYSYFTNKKCEVGDSISMYVTNKKPKRTEQQNRYYWFYLGIISDETGEKDIMRLHCLFKKKFIKNQRVVVLGEEVEMDVTTTEMTISEFCEYILSIEEFTEIPAPDTTNYNLPKLR